MKCVSHLSCVVNGPIYGRFMGCTVNGFSLYKGKPYATMPMFADAHISSFNLWLNACPFIYLNPEKKYPLAFGQSPCTGH